MGDTNYIKVKLICWQQTVRIADLHIPLATRNTYISQRFTNGIFYAPLNGWVEHNFLSPNTIDSMPGWTNQSIYCQRLNDNESYLNPYTTNLIAEFKIFVVNDPNLIGDTILAGDIIRAGSSLTLGNLAIGDTLGGPGYTNLVEHFLPIIFTACRDSNQTGSGRGVLNNQQNHIDTYCNNGINFLLKDISRRASFNPHGHSGLMRSTEYIGTHYASPSNPYPGTFLFDPDNSWVDTAQVAGVDAHVYTGLIYDYMLTRLNRNGVDSIGSNMITCVRVSAFNNWSGFDESRHIVAIGTASSPFLPFSGEIDLMAHEWAHGITHFSSQLDSLGEARALDESFSDMFGVSVGYATNDPDLLIGEHVWPDQRNLENPNLSIPPQPNTYLGQYWNYSGDYYINMGVPNKMFSLLAFGGTHNNIVVQGIGVESAIKLMYEANRRRLWPVFANFWNARDGCIQAALLTDSTTHKARNVADAWNAVNVCDTCSYIPGDVNNNGEARGSDIIYLAAFFKGGTPPPYTCQLPYQVGGSGSFYVAADYNGDCQINGADVTWGVAYFKGLKPEIRYCPQFSPGLP